MIFRGFSIDQETRASRVGRGGSGSGALALSADDKEQGEIASARGEKIFGCCNHGSDDAFGIAGAATPEIVLIFTGAEEWRNSVHVGRERDDGVAPENVDIVAIGLDANAFDLAAVTRGKR